jgi:hypothetical protein
MTRRRLLEAAEANRAGGRIPALDPAEQRVRSCAIELARDQHFKDHARHGLFAPLDTESGYRLTGYVIPCASRKVHSRLKCNTLSCSQNTAAGFIVQHLRGVWL